MDNTGWISLHRKIMDSPLYFAEPFTRMQAWIDLLLIANHTKRLYYIRGNKVTIERGQIGMSKESLAIRWQWSRGKVMRFLNDLENEQQVIQQKSPVISLISIVNYEMYQQCNTTDRQQNPPPSTSDIPPKKASGNKGTSPVFHPPTLQEVESYCNERKNNIDAQLFIDYYTARGWMIGKNKMKDWRAAVRTWEGKQKEAKNKSQYIHPSCDYLNDKKHDSRF